MGAEKDRELESLYGLVPDVWQKDVSRAHTKGVMQPHASYKGS